MKTQKRCKGVALFAAMLLLFGALFLPLSVRAAEGVQMLYVGGVPFGVRFMTDGILVVGYCDVAGESTAKNPARDAGLRPGDCIIKLNEAEVKSSAELARLVAENGEKALCLTYRRGTDEGQATLVPLACKEDGRARLGLWVRDSGAGIGTVTFVSEDGRSFGGLGHGICDGESGRLIPMSRGSVMGVTVGGITKGAIGAPGEIRGHFSAGKTGALLQNTECGVFGMFAETPRLPLGKPIAAARRDEVQNGPATLWCTLDDNTPHEYGIEISAINRGATGNKCFTVKVTDPALLAKTGGIVQGMSGSPIIQNGKLVGAVTHVLIGDPTTGYGIFIENMLNAAQTPMAKAS